MIDLLPLSFKRVVLSLGSNLFDPKENIIKALNAINSLKGCKVEKISEFYKTLPWGYASKNQFLNIVALISTIYSPWELLLELKKIEMSLGRDLSTKKAYQDRIIDIDIVFYEDQRIEQNFLKIPHPYAHLRGFVVIPALEVIPNWIHPTQNKSIKTIFEENPDYFTSQGVEKLGDSCV
ncbi:MAG: 2-amino-4-hydroxy-6-hydroxymethyldihydropteridine diphosphokinase [Thermodesulfobacteria bacterium]|nr:2-amino-4-hydroxy-6-hydroxymethyldihydropteridine diphosphokinase [Thermodesulfobacteriota bacterium]